MSRVQGPAEGVEVIVGEAGSVVRVLVNVFEGDTEAVTLRVAVELGVAGYGVRVTESVAVNAGLETGDSVLVTVSVGLRVTEDVMTGDTVTEGTSVSVRVAVFTGVLVPVKDGVLISVLVRVTVGETVTVGGVPVCVFVGLR